MKTLRHQIDADLSEAGVASMIALFEEAGAKSLTKLLGMTLSKEIEASFDYRPVDAQSSNFQFGRVTTVKSDVLFFMGGILVVELATSTGGFPRVGLLAQALLTQTSINFVAFSPTYVGSSEILMNALKVAYSALSKEIPEPLRGQTAEYFVQQAHRDHTEYLRRLKEDAQFVGAEYDADDLALSMLMAEKQTREFIIRVVQARHLPEAKFSEEISALANGDKVAKTLTDGNFVRRETFIECRKSNRQIAHFDAGDLDLSSLAMRCVNCNRLYKDEKLYCAYACTEKLKEVVQSSRWMNILVTSYLSALGIPLEFIFWNMKFGADEIDIVAFIDGLPWAFELKDTEFSVSDAHHFNYRRSIIKPAEAFVISTSIVSPDAKRVFKDVSGENSPTTLLGGGNSKLPMPTLVEGLEGVKEAIEVQMSTLARAGLRWTIRNAISGMNSNITEIIAKKFEPS